ncbi:MAG TPA: glycosyl transferase [Planctomycetaceae bacterium]|jgi:glycosyltransferase involved in cell wall biosynthesis|nr:glycosyl transferase [Planctomycetaceae bacterium]
MRVLLLIPTLDQSGAEKQLMLLATGLPRPEVDVRVCCLTRGGPYQQELEQQGIPVTILHKRFRFDPLCLSRLRRLLREWTPDVLHTWLFAGNAYGRLAAGRQPRFPVVISERCVDTWKAGWQFRVDRALLPRTTRLIANSQSVAEFYRGQGFPADRLQVIPNGIDLPDPRPDRDAIRRELDIPPHLPVVCFAGRLARQKRIDDLIWAFELIRATRTNVLFLIAGEGPEGAKLREFALGLGLEHHVRFLGHREDVGRLLAASDLFWLASDFEGMSNSVMEAMAHGLPVVASDIPPNRELVVPGETGYLVPVGDRAAFTQFADRLLFDPALARQLGTAGRDRIATGFSTARMIAAHLDLYRQVCQAREPCVA